MLRKLLVALLLVALASLVAVPVALAGGSGGFTVACDGGTSTGPGC